MDDDTTDGGATEPRGSLGEDPFATFRARSEQLLGGAGDEGADTEPVASPSTGAGDEPITSWEDLIEDDDWMSDGWGEPGGSDGAAQDARSGAPAIAVPDVAGDVVAAISQIFSRPTNDFEIQYQQGYAVLRDAAQRLHELTSQIEAAGIALDDPRAAELADQLDRLRSMHDEHVRRHTEYRELMDPTTGRYGKQIAQAAQQGAEERSKIIRDANASVAGTHAKVRASSDAAAAARNLLWLNEFRSSW